jgi:hypothetical protein
MRHLHRSLLFFVLVLGSILGFQQAVAQDASPAADCAQLSEAEIGTLAENYLIAVETGDAEQIDEILHDDVSHNLDDAANNVPGNDDEIVVYGSLGEIDFTIMELLVSEETQSATILYSFSFMDGQVTGTAIAIVELECGQVKDIHQESTALGALLVTGVAPEATPAS